MKQRNIFVVSALSILSTIALHGAEDVEKGIVGFAYDVFEVSHKKKYDPPAFKQVCSENVIQPGSEERESYLRQRRAEWAVLKGDHEAVQTLLDTKQAFVYGLPMKNGARTLPLIALSVNGDMTAFIRDYMESAQKNEGKKKPATADHP